MIVSILIFDIVIKQMDDTANKTKAQIQETDVKQSAKSYKEITKMDRNTELSKDEESIK
jgi:hypothetical protein